MKRTNYYTITIIGLVFLVGLGLTNGSLYENYLEGRWITSARDYNTSVMIGADDCYTSIYDNTINFTCGGNIIGDLNLTENITIPHLNNYYAEIYYANYTITNIFFTDASTYYKLFFTDAMLNGFTANNLTFGGATSLTTNKEGVYSLVYTLTGYGVNNHEYHTVIFVNEVEIEKCESFEKMSATGDYLSMNANCILSLNLNDNVTMRIADYTSPSTGIYNVGNVNLIRVGNI